jgi:hypothetical protein
MKMVGDMDALATSYKAEAPNGPFLLHRIASISSIQWAGGPWIGMEIAALASLPGL